MTVALLRPHSWDLPLFLHVLGATLLFGGMLTVTILALTAWRRRDWAPVLTQLVFRALLTAVVPSFVLMRIAAQWTLDREQHTISKLGDQTWVGLGFAISDSGIAVVVVLAVLAFLSARRQGGRMTIAVAVIAPLYTIALGVAWFAMSAKPGGGG